MRGGGRGRKKEAVGGAMPLAAGRGVMPLGGEGRWRCDAASSPARCDAARRSRGVMPPRDGGGGATLPCVTGGDGVMPLRGDDSAMLSSRGGSTVARCHRHHEELV
jgi:hypothetical protein